MKLTAKHSLKTNRDPDQLPIVVADDLRVGREESAYLKKNNEVYLTSLEWSKCPNNNQ